MPRAAPRQEHVPRQMPRRSGRVLWAPTSARSLGLSQEPRREDAGLSHSLSAAPVCWVPGEERELRAKGVQ